MMSRSRQATNPKHANPGTAATAAWILGSTVIASGVTYFVLREVFARQVVNYCATQAANLARQLGQQGIRPGGPAPNPAPTSNTALALQVRGMF